VQVHFTKIKILKPYYRLFHPLADHQGYLCQKIKQKPNKKINKLSNVKV